MPPLQDNALTYSPFDGPTIGRRVSHRSSAIVSREVLMGSQLGLLEPAVEEPCGLCIYAHNSILTQGEEMTIQTNSHAFKVQSTASGSCARMETLPLATRRSGKRREARNSVQITDSGLTTSPCAWMLCIDNSCTIL